MRTIFLCLGLSLAAAAAGWFFPAGPPQSAASPAPASAAAGKPSAQKSSSGDAARTAIVPMDVRLRRKLRWALLTPAEIAATASDLARSGATGTLLTDAMSAWMEVDFPAALKAWRASDRGISDEAELCSALHTTDAARLPDFLRSLTGPSRGSTIGTLLAGLHGMPVRQTWQLLTQSFPEMMQGDPGVSLHELFGTSHPDRVNFLWPLLVALPPSNSRDELLADILKNDEAAFGGPVNKLAMIRLCREPLMRKSMEDSTMESLWSELRSPEGEKIKVDEATMADLQTRYGPLITDEALRRDLSLLDAMPTDEDRDRSFSRLMDSVRSGGADAVVKLLNDLQPYQPEKRLENLGDMAGKLDGKEAFRLVNSLTDPEERRAVLSAASNALSEANREKFFDLLEAEPDPESLFGTFSAASGNGTEDREKNLALAMKLKSPAARRAALGGIVVEWSEKNLEEAAAFIARQPDSADRAHLYWMLPVTKNDTAGLAKIISQIESPTERSVLLAESLNMKSGYITEPDDPLLQVALQDTSGTMAADPKLRDILSQAYGKTSQDPASLRASVESMPDGPLRAAAASAMTGTWMQQDPEAASRWVSSLPPGPGRDAASAQVISATLESDPARARAWIDSLTDPALRQEWLEKAGKGN